MREEVYGTIQRWIVEGTLQPGEKLTDGELALRLGVSRTPVREAFRRLEDEGLVETARNRWTRVASIDTEQAEHIYSIVCALESLAASLACPRLRSTDVVAMEQAIRDLREALEVGDSVRAVAADDAFHDTFVARSENPYLVAALRPLKLKLRRLEIAYFGGSSVGGSSVARASLTEHQRILTALLSGNSERAVKIVTANWQRSLKRYRKRIRPKIPGRTSDDDVGADLGTRSVVAKRR